MLALGVAALTFLTARGLGRVMMARVPSGVLSLPEREALSLGLGLGGMAYLVFALGLLGWLSPAAIWALVAAGLVANLASGAPLAARAAWRALRFRVSILGAPYATRAGTFHSATIERLLVVVLAAMSTLNLIAALAPPTGVDPLVYHLAIPRLYLMAGGIEFVPGNYYSNQPFTMQMLFVAALAMGSDSAAQVLHWGMGMLAVWAIVLQGRRVVPRPAPLLAGVLFYSISDVMVQSSLALADLGAASLFLLGTLALFRWLERPQPALLVVSAALAGLFAASRISNPIGAMALAGLIVVVGVRRKWPLRLALGSATVFGVLAFLVVLPWYVKTWILAGNPVYPFLYDLLGGLALTPTAAEDIFAAQYHDVEAGYSVLDLLAVPWTLTFDAQRLHSGQIGPLYLGLLPLALTLRQPRQARWILLLAVIFLPLWFWSYPRTRTLLPVLGLLALPLAGTWLTLARARWGWTRWVLAAVLGVWLAVSLAANVRYHAPAIPAGLGLEDRQAYLTRVLPRPPNEFPWYEDFQVLNQQLPADARVLLWETRGYYLERPNLWARSLSQSIPPERIDDPAALVERARQLGVSHLVLPASAMRDGEMERLRRTILRSDEVEEQFRTSRLTVYAVPPVNVSPPPTQEAQGQ